MRGCAPRAESQCGDGPHQRGPRIGHDPLEQSKRPRRGGDHLPRPRAKTQPELQRVKSCFGMAPLGEFIAPRRRELRAAQLIRIVGRETFGDRAVFPLQPRARRDPSGRSLCSCRPSRPARPRPSPRGHRARSRRPVRCASGKVRGGTDIGPSRRQVRFWFGWMQVAAEALAASRPSYRACTFDTGRPTPEL
jgi:hypothetical protein